jgi:hypothetical protein
MSKIKEMLRREGYTDLTHQVEYETPDAIVKDESWLRVPIVLKTVVSNQSDQKTGGKKVDIADRERRVYLKHKGTCRYVSLKGESATEPSLAYASYITAFVNPEGGIDPMITAEYVYGFWVSMNDANFLLRYDQKDFEMVVIKEDDCNW